MGEWWRVDIVRLTPKAWHQDTRTKVGTVKALWTKEQGALNYVKRMQLDGSQRNGFVGVVEKSHPASKLTMSKPPWQLLPYLAPLSSFD